MSIFHSRYKTNRCLCNKKWHNGKHIWYWYTHITTNSVKDFRKLIFRRTWSEFIVWVLPIFAETKYILSPSSFKCWPCLYKVRKLIHHCAQGLTTFSLWFEYVKSVFDDQATLLKTTGELSLEGLVASRWSVVYVMRKVAVAVLDEREHFTLWCSPIEHNVNM